MAQKTALSVMGTPGRTYSFSAKVAVSLDIVAFTLYVEQSLGFTLYVEQSLGFTRYIEQSREISVER